MSYDERTRRDGYNRTLAWKWIRVHRPDIEELIRAESEKKFPQKEGRIELPSSLRTKQ